MDPFLVAARLLLAAVFLTAGIAKLADLAGSRQAMRDFGVPGPLAAPLGTLLPFAELAVAVALIPSASARVGALGAAVLLLAFVAGIGVNLARGRQPDCHCFGQVHSSPAGWPTLLRNLALAAVAGFVAVEGPGEVHFTALAIVSIAGGALIALLTWFVFQLFKQQGRLLLRVDELEATLAAGGVPAAPARAPQEGLAVGSPAPDFNLPGLHGERLTLESLRSPGRPVMLVFTDPGCGPCSALLPTLGTWQAEHGNEVSISLISRGSPEDNRAKSDEHSVSNVLLQDDREVAISYEANATPTAVLVRPDGTVGSPLAVGPDAIRALMAQSLDAPPATLLEVIPPGATAVGQAAPELSLPDLDGEPFDLGDLRGERVLLLFWDPACGFCARMLDELVAWTEDPPDDAPQVVIVSRGSVEVNRAMSLDVPVLLDPDWSATRAFGATGTPMAVLVDDDGRIASDVVAGADAVFERLRTAPPAG